MKKNLKETNHLDEIEKESNTVLLMHLINPTKEVSDQQAKLDAEELCVKYIKKRFQPVSFYNNETEVWCKIDNIYVEIGRTIIDQYLRLIYKDVYTKQKFNKIITKVISDCYVYQHKFLNNINIHHIPLRNGVYDLKTHKLKSYDACEEYFFTKIDIDYNPNAKCPKFIKFIGEVLKNGEEDVTMMQEAVGNILIGDYRFQKAVIMMGKGGNGKGVFQHVLEQIFKNVTSFLDLSQITKKGDNFEISNLFGKWLNISGDIGKKDFLENTGMFKRLTGEDYIEAQRKKISSISFKNRAKLFLACNQLPYSNDSSDGFFRRWLYFEFDKKFVDNVETLKGDGSEIQVGKLSSNVKKKNTNLKKELSTKSELEGILVWIIEGAERLLKNKRFSNSKTQLQIKNLWRLNSDPIGSFIEKYIEEDVESYIPKKLFKDKLQKFAPSVNISDKDIVFRLRNEFNNIDGNRKIRIKGISTRVWKGIKLIKDEEDNKSKDMTNIFEED